MKVWRKRRRKRSAPLGVPKKQLDEDKLFAVEAIVSRHVRKVPVVESEFLSISKATSVSPG